MLHGVWTLGLLTFAKALKLENFGCATPLEYTTAIGGFGLRVNSANASISGLSVGVQLDVGDQCSRTYTPSISIDKFTYNYTLQAGVLALVLPTIHPRDDNAGFYGTVEGTNLVFVQGRAGPSDSQFTLIPMCNTTGGRECILHAERHGEGSWRWELHRCDASTGGWFGSPVLEIQSYNYKVSEPTIRVIHVGQTAYSSRIAPSSQNPRHSIHRDLPSHQCLISYSTVFTLRQAL